MLLPRYKSSRAHINRMGQEHQRLLTKCRRDGRRDNVTAQAKVRRGGKVLDVPPNLRTFAEGLQRAYSTIKAALTLPCSNGPMEGQINRLKFVKHSIFGRGNFQLLCQRVLRPV